MSDPKSKGKMLIITLVLVVIIAFVVIFLVNRGDDETPPAETNNNGQEEAPEEVTQESIVAELKALETRIETAIETATVFSGEFEALIEAGCDDFSSEKFNDVLDRYGLFQEEVVEFNKDFNAIGDKAKAEPGVDFEKIPVSDIQTKMQTLSEAVSGLEAQYGEVADFPNTCNSESSS